MVKSHIITASFSKHLLRYFSPKSPYPPPEGGNHRVLKVGMFAHYRSPYFLYSFFRSSAVVTQMS